MKEFHWFVSHGLGWKTGATLQEAIEGAFCTSWYGDMRGWLLNCQKDGKAGIGFFACKVLAPSDENYSIEFFAPQGVETEEGQNLTVTYVTQKKVAWMKDPCDEISRLNNRIEEIKERMKGCGSYDEFCELENDLDLAQIEPEERWRM